MDDGRLLDLVGTKHPRYHEFVSEGVGFTIGMRISAGHGGTILPEFVVFQRKNSSYPIQGVPADVQNYKYRSNPSGWMNRNMFGTYFTGDRVITALIEFFMLTAAVHTMKPSSFRMLFKPYVLL